VIANGSRIGAVRHELPVPDLGRRVHVISIQRVKLQ
jgi:hypothetical protein